MSTTFASNIRPDRNEKKKKKFQTGLRSIIKEDDFLPLCLYDLARLIPQTKPNYW